jgi:glycosyl transferase family 25
MRTFVVNLPQFRNRREHILRQLDATELRYEFAEAVNGPALDSAQIARLCHPALLHEYPIQVPKGHIGCALSHINIYRKVVEEGIDRALVLEDDAVLPPNITSVLDQLTPKLHANEIVLLFYVGSSAVPCRLSSRRAEPVAGSYQLLCPVDLSLIGSTLGYLITNQACRTMLQANYPMRAPADEWAIHYKNGGFTTLRCIYPRLLDEAFLQTSIDYRAGQPFRRAIANLIEKYRLFPLYQLARRRRMAVTKRRSSFQVVDVEGACRLEGNTTA